MANVLHCPSCGWGYSDALLLRPENFSCPGCSASTRVLAFPRLWDSGKASGQAHAHAEGEATCYYHAKKRAVQSCDECGRFICSLCDIEQGQRHLCPRCLGGGNSVQDQQALGPDMRRFRWDMATLGIAVLSTAFFFFFIHFLITGPAIVFLVVKYWRRRPSLAMDARQQWGHYARLSAALFVGLAQLAWSLFLVALLFREWG